MRQVEHSLTWGEPPEQVADKIASVRRRAALAGRTVRFGIRPHFIVHETEEAAWAAADGSIAHVSDAQIEQAQKRFLQQMDSVGQRRMSELHGGRRDRLRVAPNLWAGIGLVRSGAGTALVGSPENVVARIREYQALGIETIVGAGYPHLESAYETAELLFLLLGIGRYGAGKLDTQINEFAVSGGAVPRRQVAV